MKKYKTAISTYDFIQLNNDHKIATLKDIDGNMRYGFKQPTIVSTIIGLNMSANRHNKKCFISYKHLKKIIGEFSLKTYNLARKKLAKLGYIFTRRGIKWLLSKKQKPLPPDLFVKFLNDNFRFLKYHDSKPKFDCDPPDPSTDVNELEYLEF